MTDKTKFIKITAIEDANDMFEAICSDILKKDATEAKKQLLGMNGKDSQIEKHKVTINQLIAVISRLGMSFELKVNYVEVDVKKDVVTEPKEDEGGLKVDHVVKSMEEQKAAITNPDLKDMAAGTPKDKVDGVKANDIPDPPDFM